MGHLIKHPFLIFFGLSLLGACGRENLLQIPSGGGLDGSGPGPLDPQLDAGGTVEDNVHLFVALDRTQDEGTRRAVIHSASLDSTTTDPTGVQGWGSACKAIPKSEESGEEAPTVHCVIQIEESELLMRGLNFKVNYPNIPACAFAKESPSWFWTNEMVNVNGHVVAAGGPASQDLVITSNTLRYRDSNFSMTDGENTFVRDVNNFRVTGENDEVIECTSRCCYGTYYTAISDTDTLDPPAITEVDLTPPDECAYTHLKRGGEAFPIDEYYKIPTSYLKYFGHSTKPSHQEEYSLPFLSGVGSSDDFFTYFSLIAANFFLPKVTGDIDWRVEHLFPLAFRPAVNMSGFAVIDSSNPGVTGQVTMAAPAGSTAAAAASRFACLTVPPRVRLVSDAGDQVFEAYVRTEPSATCAADGNVILTSDQAGTTPVALPLPFTDGYMYRPNHSAASGGWGLNPEPFHTFSCLDSAHRTTAQIKVMVQEWDRVDKFDNFLAWDGSGSPARFGTLSPDSSDADNIFDNTLMDWFDLARTWVNGLDNGGMQVFPSELPGFPIGQDEDEE